MSTKNSTITKKVLQTAVIDSKILSFKCPRCGSDEIGYCFPSKEYDCAACEHVWRKN